MRIYFIAAWDNSQAPEKSFGWIEDYARYRTGAGLAIQGPTRAAHDNINDKPDTSESQTVLLESGVGYPQGYGPLNMTYRPVVGGGEDYREGFAMFRMPTITTYYPLPGVDAIDYYGNKITVGDKPVMVTHLGRYRKSDNAQMHALAIFRAEPGANDAAETPTEIVASCMVDASLPGESDGFNYARLEQPIILNPGETYYLASLENTFTAFGGGDQFPSEGAQQAGIPDSELFGSGFTVDQEHNYTRTTDGAWAQTELNGGRFAPMVSIKVN
jgi:hypothetical protein